MLYNKNLFRKEYYIIFTFRNPTKIENFKRAKAQQTNSQTQIFS